jgi:hypothetical protein
MSRSRYPLPTDLVALVFDGRVYPNEAKPWDRLGRPDRARPLEGALEQWFSFATGKHTWINVRGTTIRGLVSARPRNKRSAWEVETLIDADGDGSVVVSLLTRMLAGVAKQGAERVFMRLEAASPLVRAARDAGFFAYQTQTLYRLEGPPRAVEDGAAPLRPRRKGELFGVWQLYNRTIPANVRAVEGPTFREWQAAFEPWGGRTSDFVLEDDGVITAWVRMLNEPVARLAVLASGDVGGVLSAALAQLKRAHVVLCLAPEETARGVALPGSLAAALLEAGFAPAGSYVLMARRLARVSKELVPETSGTAVPVN